MYDGSGQRVRKINELANDAGIKNERLYLGGAFEVYRDREGLERETLHLMDDTRRIAMIDTRTKGNDEFEEQTIRYQLGNHLGSVSLEVNENAEVISYEEYHPYGTTAFQAKNANINAAAKRYRYTGMERDEETGMNYHSARYYLVWLGRWLSADPIGIGDGVNLYRYTSNNPLNKKDTNGKFEFSLKSIVGKATDVVVAVAAVVVPNSGVSSLVSTLSASEGGRQFLEGEVEAAIETGVGLAVSGVERAGRLAKEVAENPVESMATVALSGPGLAEGVTNLAMKTEGKHMLNEVQKEAKKSGVNYAEAANNLHNPIKGLIEHGAKMKEAFENGDFREAGKQHFSASMKFAETVAIIEGGLKAARRMKLKFDFNIDVGKDLKTMGGSGNRKSPLKSDLSGNPEKIGSLVNKPKTMTALEKKAMGVRAAVEKETGLATEGGTAAHDVLGAKGRGIPGVDIETHGGAFHKEYKTHRGPMFQDDINSASKQSLRYSTEHQRKHGTVPIRMVVHLYEMTNKFVKFNTH